MKIKKIKKDGFLTRLIKFRQRYRWRKNKGANEMSVFLSIIDLIRYFITRTIYLLGFSFGTKVISPEIAKEIENWWPGAANFLIWLSLKAREMIVVLVVAMIVWYFIKIISYQVIGLWLEKSGFVRVEDKANRKRYDYFTMEEIVKPLQRIEKKLGINKKKEEDDD